MLGTSLTVGKEQEVGLGACLKTSIDLSNPLTAGPSPTAGRGQEVGLETRSYSISISTLEHCTPAALRPVVSCYTSVPFARRDAIRHVRRCARSPGSAAQAAGQFFHLAIRRFPHTQSFLDEPFVSSSSSSAASGAGTVWEAAFGKFR